MPTYHESNRTPSRINMLSAAISVALFPVAGQSLAQSSPGEPQMEEVIVTGSRITRFEGDYVAPVLSLDAGQLERSGKVNVEDFVSEVAALVGSSGGFESGDEGGARTGVNALNLRNLGTNRTLVLVNGRRHVSSLATGEPLVDTNTIPTALIERVDVLTGGASAVYGADAVSGAVNFVLQDNFEGFEARAQGGISSRGDAEEYFSSFVWGTNFNEERGNITASYEFRRQEPLATFERSYGIDEAEFLVNNPAEYLLEDDPDVPDQIIARDQRYTYTAVDGRYDIEGYDAALGRDVRFGELVLNAGGQPYDVGTPINGFAALGGDGTPTRYFSDEFIPESEVHSFNLLGRYDLNDMATAFTELKYVRTEAENPRSPSFTSKLELSLDNPFISDGFVDALSSIQDPTINLARDDLELRYRDDNTRDTFRSVVGVRGEITDWLNYEVSANYGVTEVEARLTNMRREDRYFAAIDAVTDPRTGQPTCRSNLDPSAVPPNDAIVSSYNPDVWGDPANSTFVPGPDSGCVPFNPFLDGTSGFYSVGGIDPNAPNAKAIDFITGNGVPLVDRGEINQTVINGFLSGNSSGLGLNLPAGPVDFVVGGEYREEEVSNDVDAIRNNTNGLTPLGFERDTGSSFDVTEAFTEVSVPVFEDLGPFMQMLRVDGAYRFSDYSTIGQTTAFSTGVNWTLNDNVIVRGSFGRSVRAPNLEELFAPENEGSFRPSDPCEASSFGRQSANTQANCIADLATVGLTPEEFISASPVGRPGVVGGNPDLGEETADTSTIGIVLTPTALPGFVATLDAWEIEMTDGVLYPSSNEIVEQCYDAPSLDNQFCQLFTRASDGITGVIIDVEQRPVNVSALSTSGIDFSLGYDMDLGLDAGMLSLSLSGTHLNELLTQPTVAPKLVDEAGQIETLLGGQAPEWVFNFDAFWERGPLSVNYGVHFQSELDLFMDDELAREPDLSAYTSTDRLIVHDIQADYDVSEGWTAYLGVNNIGDRQPDATFLNTPIGGRGRFVYAGMSVSFENLGSLRSLY